MKILRCYYPFKEGFPNKDDLGEYLGFAISNSQYSANGKLSWTLAKAYLGLLQHLGDVAAAVDPPLENWENLLRSFVI